MRLDLASKIKTKKNYLFYISNIILQLHIICINGPKRGLMSLDPSFFIDFHLLNAIKYTVH